LRESVFQQMLVLELREMFPDCLILRNNPNHLQGVPDLLILNGNKWAALECKRHENAVHGANQDYYVELMDKMSFAAFIHPGNKEQVLDALQRALRSRRTARFPRAQ
jgi:hypothetical protein